MSYQKKGTGSNQKKTTGPKPKAVSDRLKNFKFSIEKIECLAEIGLTDEQIASVLGRNIRTINRWKKDPKFLKALKSGKQVADAKVIASLYKRATGYNYIETYRHKVKNKIVEFKITTKEMAGDTTAMIFWLKNRQPEDWRDTKSVTVQGSIKIEDIEISLKKIACE